MAALTTLGLLAGTSSALSIATTLTGSQQQQRQMKNERLKMEIAASEASTKRLEQTAQIVSSNMAAQSAAGMRAGANRAVMGDQYQMALDDIDSIQFQLQAGLAQNKIQAADAKNTALLNSIGTGLNTGMQMANMFGGLGL